MAQKTYNARVKWKRDTSANWTSNNPVLLDGEIIIVDTSSGETRFKIGDGTKKYSQLPFEDEAVRSLISAKVDKVSGKELSSNDYTDAEKSKLAGIAAEANKTTVDSALSSTSTNPVQNKVINSALAGKAASSHTHSIANVSGLQSALDGKAASGHTHAAATDGSDGFMASEDKAKLDGIASGANKYTHPSYTSRSSGLYKLTVDSTGHISAASAVTKADIVALGIPGQDTNTTYGNASSSSAGLMSAADKAKLDGISSGANKTVVDASLSSTSTNPVQNKVINSALAGKAASSHTHGVSNISGLQDALDSKASSSHTHSTATTSADGFMSSEDKAKLNGVASGANKYTHPSYTSRSSGLYKVTVDSSGHVSAVSSVAKSDITALGIPGTNTTYGIATDETDGLMSAEDKAKLDGISSGANKTTVDSALSSTSTNPVQNKVINSALAGKASSKHGHSVATDEADGFMSSGDKAKLDGIASGANKYSHPTSSGNKHIPSGGSSGQILRWSADGTAAWGSDNNTTYSTFKAASSSAAGGSGLVPAPAAGAANRYLRSDGTWSVPPDTNTTYGVATTSANGLMSSSDKSKLNGIATGANKTTVDSALSSTSTNPVQNKVINSALAGKASSGHTHGTATSSADGFMASEDKSKLDGIASGANKYTHPSYTSRSSGLYKVTVDSSGHVSAATAVTKSDITALGIPSTNTTYSVATTSANGLMSASDKTKLNGIATNANNYVHPTSAGNKHIPSGGSSGQILCWSASGTAKWGNVGSIIYSTDEVDTGNAWIDGRPIYSKMILFSAPTNANASTAVTFDFSSIDTAWVDPSSTFFIARDATTTISHPGYMADTGARLFMAQLRPDRDQLLVVTNIAGTAYIRVCYTKTADDPTYYYLPFLHSSSEQNCVITSSSIFSNLYTREYAFNGLTADYWACLNNDADRWIQVRMPYALRNMTVTLVSPQGSAVRTNNIPVSGSFQGSNNGSTWAILGNYAGRSTAAGSTTTHSLNHSTGYRYLRVKVTSPGSSSGTWTGFGDIRIEGEVVT